MSNLAHTLAAGVLCAGAVLATAGPAAAGPITVVTAGTCTANGGTVDRPDPGVNGTCRGGTYDGFIVAPS